MWSSRTFCGVRGELIHDKDVARAPLCAVDAVERKRKTTVSFLFDTSDEAVHGGLGWLHSWDGLATKAAAGL